MNNFWKKLNKPFFILAPMDNVTDHIFREFVAKHAPPDVFFTEFTNVDGLNSPGRKRLMPRLIFSKKEHPIVAQIWGLDPKNYFKAARELLEMGFDGIDINMGCPVKTVVKNGACSALIKNPTLAAEIIAATKEGAKSIPVSVKTRIGFNTIETDEWIGFLLGQQLSALTVHGRTVKEQSAVPAHWDEIKKAVKLRDLIAPQTVIIGNGDVKSREDGIVKVKESGVEGIMIGRGIFDNFWVFEQTSYEHSISERLEVLLEHTRDYVNLFKGIKNFDTLKKFYKIYINNFEGAKELRIKLMDAQTLEQVEEIVKDYKNNHKVVL